MGMVEKPRKYAVVDEEGKVVNSIVATSDFDPGEGLELLASDHAGPRWTWDGTEFHPPEPRSEEIDPKEAAALEAIKDEPSDSPLRLAVEALLGSKTKEEIQEKKR